MSYCVSKGLGSVDVLFSWIAHQAVSPKTREMDSVHIAHEDPCRGAAVICWSPITSCY